VELFIPSSIGEMSRQRKEKGKKRGCMPLDLKNLE
jgi:hypothetical protein